MTEKVFSRMLSQVVRYGLGKHGEEEPFEPLEDIAQRTPVFLGEMCDMVT